MSKKIFLQIIVLIVALLVFTGCRGGAGFGGAREDGDEHYMTGTQGIVLNFLRGSPPAVIYDTDNFDLALELRNKGTSTTTVDYYFTGYDPINL